MNAGEKARIRKMKQRQQWMRLWLPVILVVTMITALTAGGIGLSLAQSHEGGQTQQEKPAPEGQQPQTEEASSEAASQEAPQTVAPTTEPEVTTVPDYSGEQAEFDQFIANLAQALEADDKYFSADGEELTRSMADLKTFERDHLTEDQQKTYDVVLDGFNIEFESQEYASIKASVNGNALCSIEGGSEYYAYLLKKYSGTDDTWEVMHERLAADAMEAFQVLTNISTADPTIPPAASSFTKQTPDSAYAYETVTAESSALKKKLTCNGMINGWMEFGLIRAYQADPLLDDLLRNYLIMTTRMTYSLYGVADLAVHAGGWGEAEVVNLCSQFFANAGGSDFGSNVYQMVLKSPGRYAAAAIDYLEITKIEQALSQNLGANYSEAVLLDVLFRQGPASFRVINSWLGI